MTDHDNQDTQTELDPAPEASLAQVPEHSDEEADSDAHTNIVQLLSPKLNSAQRRHLRSLAHALKPVVLVGNKGVTDPLIEQVEAALLAHELIRVKVHDREALDEVATLLHQATGAQLAQRLGKTLLFFRAHPSQPKIALPGVAPRRPKAKKSSGSHGHKKRVARITRQAQPTKVKKNKDDTQHNANGRRPRPSKKHK
jgi:RNA-binding protein